MSSPGCSDSEGVKSSHAADEKKPTAAIAPGRADDEEAPAAKRDGMTRLPELEVTQILSRDPRSIEPYKVEVMRRRVQDLRPKVPEETLRVLAKSLNEDARKKFIVFQNWIRGEFDGKGYVEVPDEFFREREEAQKGQEGRIRIDDPHLPADKYFTTVYGKEDDDEEKLVFSFTKKADSDSMERSEDEDEEESESDEDDDD